MSRLLMMTAVVVACAAVLVAGGYGADAQTDATTFESEAAGLQCGQSLVVTAELEVIPQDSEGPTSPKGAFDGLLTHIEEAGSGFHPSDYEVRRLEGQDGTLFVLRERESGQDVLVARTPDFGPWWAVDALAFCDDLA